MMTTNIGGHRAREGRARGVSTACRRLQVVLILLLCSLAGRARADSAEPKRLVFYVEAPTPLALLQMRAALRSAIPDRVMPIDGIDFRASMVQRGQQGQIRQYLGTARERAIVFDRIQQSAAEVHADGVVFVALEGGKKRLARVIVLLPGESTPTVDQLVQLDAAKEKTDSTKVAAVLAPVFERLLAPPAPGPGGAGPPPPVGPAPAAPLPAAPLPVEPPPAAPAAEVAPAAKPAEHPLPRVSPPPPRVSGEVALEFFPAGIAPNFARAKVAVPLSRSVSVVPHLGGGYVPSPADDIAAIYGAGVRLSSGRWTIEPSGYYAKFPKFVRWYQGAIAVRANFGAVERPVLRLSLTGSVTRWLWRNALGAPGSELLEGYAQVEASIRSVHPLVITPVGGYFFYDRSLLRSKAAINAVTFSLAPYPTQFFVGGTIGYDAGRWLPYVGARYLRYSADTGTGVFMGPGLKLTMGADFVDARVGFFLSDGRGPLWNSALDVVPLVNVDVGWTF